MLQSLLVPLDGSTAGEGCLPLAVNVARCSGARLHLAHVHVPYEPAELLANTSFQWEGVDLAEYDQKEIVRETDYLREWEERLADRGTDVDSRVIEGTPIADELAGYAEEVAADLIVMSSRGRSALARALLGSVSDEVVRKAPAPVLVIHPADREREADTTGRVEHVLVALDGSKAGEAALGPAQELARATGARLSLIHVISDPTYLGPRITGLRPTHFEPELDGAMDYLEGVAEMLRYEGLEAEPVIIRGDDVASAIAGVADEEDVDLVAVATHGFTGVRRAVLGTVTDGLLKKTTRPLLVARLFED